MGNPTMHARSLDLRYDEMDGRGEATPVALLSLLEEAAFTHCEESGWGVYRLLDAGYGWMLLRGGLEMRRYPAYRERFRVETWLSSTRRFYGEREYRVVAEGGEELGFARSLWAFMSLERKRPVPVLEEIVRAWAPEGTTAGDIPLGEVGFALPGEGAVDALRERAFGVRAAEIDTNGHVNNVNYLAWALESLAGEVAGDRFLASLRGHYRREVAYGSQVRSLALPTPEGYRHGVLATPPGGAEPYLAAAALSAWKPRAAAAGRTAETRDSAA